MTAKEYLGQLYWIDKHVKSRRRELDMLDQTKQSIQGIDLTRERVQCSRHGRQIENIMQRITDLENRINSEIERLLDLQIEIHDVIESVEDRTEQLLLRARYIEYLPWNDVAKKLGYADTQTHRLHSTALKRIQVKIKSAE